MNNRQDWMQRDICLTSAYRQSAPSISAAVLRTGTGVVEEWQGVLSEQLLILSE